MGLFPSPTLPFTDVWGHRSKGKEAKGRAAREVIDSMLLLRQAAATGEDTVYRLPLVSFQPRSFFSALLLFSSIFS